MGKAAPDLSVCLFYNDGAVFGDASSSLAGT